MGLAGLVPYVLIVLVMAAKMVAALWRGRSDERVDRPLLVSGLAVLAVYTVSAAAVDLYINVFSSLLLFLIVGMVIGYVSRLPAPRRHGPAVQPEEQPPIGETEGFTGLSTVGG
jgi:O-antigen ligase